MSQYKKKKKRSNIFGDNFVLFFSQMTKTELCGLLLYIL